MSKNHNVSNLGLALQKGQTIQDLLAMAGFDYQGGLTATAGGTVANSIQLLGGINEISTVTSASDGCLLPPAAAGSVCIAVNSAGANDAKIFAGAGATINGTAGATGITLTHGKTFIFVCPTAGKWSGGALA